MSMIKDSFISCFQLLNFTDFDTITKSIIRFSPKNIKLNKNKSVVGLLFDEPSSRTRFSVESSVYRLGANCITSLSMDQTSISKGETISDSAKVWSRSCDLLCVRSHLAGFAHLLSNYSTVPVLNLGDGFLEHPSQGLSTAIHAYNHFGTLNNLNICIWGDVLYSRCAHSVLIIFAINGANIWILPIPSNDVPYNIIDIIKVIKPNAKINIVKDIKDYKNKFHILYINRFQKERRSDSDDKVYDRISNRDLAILTKDGILLHPLPRGSELPDEVCSNKKSKVWEHLDLTYRTRSWLLHQYLSENRLSSTLKIHEMPFNFSGNCKLENCSSFLQTFNMLNYDQSLYSSKCHCSLCYRSTNN